MMDSQSLCNCLVVHDPCFLPNQCIFAFTQCCTAAHIDAVHTMRLPRHQQVACFMC